MLHLLCKMLPTCCATFIPCSASHDYIEEYKPKQNYTLLRSWTLFRIAMWDSKNVKSCWDVCWTLYIIFIMQHKLNSVHRALQRADTFYKELASHSQYEDLCQICMWILRLRRFTLESSYKLFQEVLQMVWQCLIWSLSKVWTVILIVLQRNITYISWVAGPSVSSLSSCSWQNELCLPVR